MLCVLARCFAAPRSSAAVRDVIICCVSWAGVSLHHARQLLFVSLNNGVVYRIENGSDTEVYRTTNHCGALDVDWLNDKLYIAERDQVGTPRHRYGDVAQS